MESLPNLRVATRDRDAAVERLEKAFLQGRLTDTELAERIDKALSAKIVSDLDAILGDLPAEERLVPGPPSSPLKFVATHKGSSTQAGPWTVPTRFKSVAYKSSQVLDLTRAVLTGPRTEIRVTAYKSTVEIVVPAGVVVEMRGWAYAGRWVNETEDGSGPVIVIKGFAYKGTVRVRRSDR